MSIFNPNLATDDEYIKLLQRQKELMNKIQQAVNEINRRYSRGRTSCIIDPARFAEFVSYKKSQ